MKICSRCGEVILTDPVMWDPRERLATPIGTPMPTRRRDPAIFAEAEAAGKQIMLGEPTVTIPGVGDVHERCAGGW